MTKSPENFSDQIRRAIDGAGMTRYVICNRIGISQSTMSRFMADKGGLSMASLNRLADLLGLAVIVRPKSKTP